MSRTYKAVGINLKSMPLGESDRLVTILTREFGLIRVVAPGARKQNSKLGGRSGMFVVNELLIAPGRSLDKITQAETLHSYPGLSQNLGKLVVSQYLAEIAIYQALSEQPQEELFFLLNEHLSRLERLPNTPSAIVLAHLSHAVFHFLALAGITPQVEVCCITQRPLIPDFDDPNWRVGFSVSAGGTVSLQALERLQIEGRNYKSQVTPPDQQQATVPNASHTASVREASAGYQTIVHQQETPVLNTRLNATELALLQQLAEAEMTQIDSLLLKPVLNSSWQFVEQLLRQYAQYHFGRPIRSAALIDSYFAAQPHKT